MLAPSVASRVSAGLCRQCGQAPEPGYKTCSRCRERATRKRREARICRPRVPNVGAMPPALALAGPKPVRDVWSRLTPKRACKRIRRLLKRGRGDLLMRSEVAL